MVNKKFWLGILVIVLVFGMTVVGCVPFPGKEDENGSETDQKLNGTWGLTQEGKYIEYKFNNGNIEQTLDSTPFTKGTYSTNENKLIIKINQIWGETYSLEAKWFTESQFKPAIIASGMIDESTYNQLFGQSFQKQTATYSINGNTLTIVSSVGGQTVTQEFTKNN